MKILKNLVIFVSILCLSGCAIIIGTSVQSLEKEKVRYSKIFEKDPSYCYAKVAEALKKWDADIFQQKKESYIIAMRLDRSFKSCTDTTELGIFFKTPQPQKTQVEVVSLNHWLSKAVAEKLFEYIEKNP